MWDGRKSQNSSTYLCELDCKALCVQDATFRSWLCSIRPSAVTGARWLQTEADPPWSPLQNYGSPRFLIRSAQSRLQHGMESRWRPESGILSTWRSQTEAFFSSIANKLSEGGILVPSYLPETLLSHQVEVRCVVMLCFRLVGIQVTPANIIGNNKNKIWSPARLISVVLDLGLMEEKTTKQEPRQEECDETFNHPGSNAA